jgi:crotonobetainyl-CoA:carnitine CoA-transferase CaiB-like acyl-CoA transferase
LDFSRLFAGPFTAQLLAEMGADVIKVEDYKKGDVARAYGVGDGAAESSSFLALNRGKRSVCLDLKTDGGREAAQRLAANADVVIENFRPAVMGRLGLDYETLSGRNPGLIYCSISGFGSRGPLKDKAANDLIIQAYSGLLTVTGEPGGGPVRAGTAIADLSTGIFGALGIVTALHERSVSGLGQHVETTLLGSQMSMMNFVFADYWMNGIVAKPLGTANRLGLPNQAFPTNDGWVVIAATSDEMWRRCCAAIGQSELADDERFNSLPQRYRNRDDLVASVSALTRNLSTKGCLEVLDQYGVSSGPINGIDETAEDAHVKAMGIRSTAQTIEGKETTVVGNPIMFSRSPGETLSRPPRLGEHTSSVLTEVGYSVEEINELSRGAAI